MLCISKVKNPSLKNSRSGQRHLLHLIIQPHMTSFNLNLRGSTHIAMNMLEERCSDSLRSLDFVYNNNMPPHYYYSFFAKFKHLTKLNVTASLVDDVAFRAIGETCSKLVELNAGSTYITNVGIKYLSVEDALVPCISNQYR